MAAVNVLCVTLVRYGFSQCVVRHARALWLQSMCCTPLSCVIALVNVLYVTLGVMASVNVLYATLVCYGFSQCAVRHSRA